EDKFFSGSHAKLYGILSIKEFFVSLNGKTGMLLKLAEKDSSLSRLQYAKQILSFCIPLLSSIQQFYDIDDSKLKLREISDETMNLGVEVCYELYRITREIKYAADAFLFSETKRNSVLNESTKNKTAMFEAQVPDSIKNLESSLRQKLKWLFISSADNLSEENENKTLNRENLIRTTVRSYKTLINSLKQNYPKYASLLAAGKILSPDELERGISKDAFLAEYTITENNIFIFCITNNSFTLVKTNKSRSFDNWNYSYRNSIKKIDKDTYNASAKELYRELVTPIEKELSGKRKLIVIPCPELSALPFEAFISSKGIPLVQNFSIQYCGSSNEFIKESRVVTKKYPYYFIGFAPSYNNLQKFAPLENQEEINEISKEIKNVGLQNILCSGPNATKQKFFDLTGKSRILHIAAHSFADTINEGSSGIVFDSLLTGSEIITREINNDLIVLSSCEGGNGKTAGGEGILSLARNFLKAGAGNMLVSLWKVPDKQTKLFMTEFYRQLIKDNNYAEALSRTKRKVIEDKLYAFPNTWAAFVLLK
ncbi:MAG: CHAT domain-containing protein, partial [Methanococcaceae archaeon]